MRREALARRAAVVVGEAAVDSAVAMQRRNRPIRVLLLPPPLTTPRADALAELEVGVAVAVAVVAQPAIQVQSTRTTRTAKWVRSLALRRVRSPSH
jgi:hypothetical protein